AFLQMLLNGGTYNGQRILGRRTVELMLAPQLKEGMFGDDNFTLGFAWTSQRSSQLNMPNTGSFAWGGYYGTTYWADPREQLVCLILTQHSPNSHGDFVEKVRNVVYGSLK